MLRVSLTLSNVLRFRALNLHASLMLTVFNATVVDINANHLARLLGTDDDERTYEVVPPSTCRVAALLVLLAHETVGVTT